VRINNNKDNKNEVTSSADGVVWAYFLHLSCLKKTAGPSITSNQISCLRLQRPPKTPCTHFAGGNNWILGLEPLPGASNTFTGRTWLKDCNLINTHIFVENDKYNEKTLIWEGPTSSSIPEFLGSGSQSQAMLFVLK
jgi:hypothetical protein